VLLRGGDPALAETVINPAFDRGHYERIEYVSASGERIVSRQLRAREGNYPEWFARALHLPCADRGVVRERRLAAGRARARHGASALRYEQLWGTARDTVILLMLIYAAALLVLQLVLRSVLRPLKAVEQAAQAISARRFVTLRLRPRTRELARVVEAMNSLSLKVSEALDAEARRAERLQVAAYQDPVTGLPNALGFQPRASKPATKARTRPLVACCALVDLADLGGINREVGTERCDELAAHAAARDGRDRGAGGRIGRTLDWSGDGPRAAAAARRRGARGARELRARIQAAARGGWLPGHARVYCGGAEAAGERPSLQALVRGAQDALRKARDTREGRCGAGGRAGRRCGPGRSSPGGARRARRAQLALVGQAAYRMSDHRALHTEVLVAAGRRHGERNGRCALHPVRHSRRGSPRSSTAR
jgi:hypothetical protein